MKTEEKKGQTSRENSRRGSYTTKHRRMQDSNKVTSESRQVEEFGALGSTCETPTLCVRVSSSNFRQPPPLQRTPAEAVVLCYGHCQEEIRSGAAQAVEISRIKQTVAGKAEVVPRLPGPEIVLDPYQNITPLKRESFLHFRIETSPQGVC